jgi:NADPH:quinone reductase-like Zn-dependent oxidoreductase
MCRLKYRLPSKSCRKLSGCETVSCSGPSAVKPSVLILAPVSCFCPGSACDHHLMVSEKEQAGQCWTAQSSLRGHLVNFGQWPGSVEPFKVAGLAGRSSSVARPILFHYIDQHKGVEQMAARVFDAVGQGVLAVEPGKVFPLAAAADAHVELESRQASGPLPLVR